MDKGRGGAEELLLDRLKALQDRLGVIFTLTPGATRRGRCQDAPLDGIALPASIAWRWALSLTWNATISDHACLSLGPASAP
eukprot:7503507-Heterocapsa_arctica.AAC.1